jgi:hypothetical protein
VRVIAKKLGLQLLQLLKGFHRDRQIKQIRDIISGMSFAYTDPFVLGKRVKFRELKFPDLAIP